MKYLIPTVAALVLLGCGSQQKEEKTAQAPAAKETAAPEATADVKTKTEETGEAVAETVEKVKEETAATEPPTDGKTVFAQKCASCHGPDAKNAALGKSQVIAGWDAARVENALRGYIDGTYGSSMKPVMQVQAKALSDAQIKAVSEYIGSL